MVKENIAQSQQQKNQENVWEICPKSSCPKLTIICPKLRIRTQERRQKIF